MNILNVAGSEQKERRFREDNLVLFEVHESTAATAGERQKEDEASVFEIFDEICAEKRLIDKVKRFEANPNKASTSKPLPIRVMLGVVKRH